MALATEDRGHRLRDPIPVFGLSSVVSDVWNGKRSISKAHARKLAEFFHVPAGLVLSLRQLRGRMSRGFAPYWNESGATWFPTG